MNSMRQSSSWQVGVSAHTSADSKTAPVDVITCTPENFDSVKPFTTNTTSALPSPSTSLRVAPWRLREPIFEVPVKPLTSWMVPLETS